MKSQDIGLLLKLECLHKREKGILPSLDSNWIDWEENTIGGDVEQHGFYHQSMNADDYIINQYSTRSLALSTGISKSQVNLALRRCFDVGLAKRDRHSGLPRVHTKALLEFIVYGLKYVFPTKLGAVTRGITTSLAAPVLEGKLISTGDLLPVWPDAQGKTKGQTVEPLFKSVTYAVRRDVELYALLALVDAVRIGQPRERNLATDLLAKRLGISR